MFKKLSLALGFIYSSSALFASSFSIDNINVTYPTDCTKDTFLTTVLLTPPTANYLFEWSNNTTLNSSSTYLSPGTYTVTVTNLSNGDKETGYILITDPNEEMFTNTLTVNLTTTPATCGLTNGSALVEVMTANGPYPYCTYTWSNGLSKNDSLADSLSSGLYAVTITDTISHCSIFKLATIDDDIGPGVNGQITKPCFGENNGKIQLFGVGNSQVIWSNGVVGAKNDHLSAGHYIARIMAPNGCKTFKEYDLQPDYPVWVEVSGIVPPSTCGGSDAQLFLSSQGGLGPYTFTVNGQNFTSPTISNLSYGLKIIKVTDQNGCIDTTRVYIDEIPDLRAIKSDQTKATCLGNDGSMGITVFIPNNSTDLYAQFDNGSWSNWGSGALFGQDYFSLSPGLKKLNLKMLINTDTCRAVRWFHLPSKKPDSVGVCVVSVNDNNRNELVWKKSTSPNIDYYNIYREDFAAGKFNLIDTVHGSSENIYLDKEVDAATKSFRYKVSVVDVCQQESKISLPHRSPHLSAYLMPGDSSIKLTWQAYKGFPWDTVEIHYKDVNDMWQLYTSLHADNASPTELTLPFNNQKDFRIEYPKDDECLITKTGGRNTGRSNTSGCCSPEFVFFTAIVDVTEATFDLCNGEALVTAVGGTPPYTYQWSDTTMNQDTRTNLCAGSYTVIVSDNMGNTTTQNFQVGETVGIQEKMNGGMFTFYPNPVQNKIWIESHSSSTSPIILSVFNMNGVLLKQEKHLPSEGYIKSMDVSYLPVGLYHLQVMTNEGNQAFKFVKE